MPHHLTKGKSDLRVGNGARVAVAALWTYVLNLPNFFKFGRLLLCPSIDKEHYFVSCLNKKSFIYIL